MTKNISDKTIKNIGDKIGVNWDKINFNQFKTGLKLELEEHGDLDPQTDVIHHSLLKAGKIALAHLKELPNYYTKLNKMEKTNESLNNDKIVTLPSNYKVPITSETITDSLLKKLANQLNIDLKNYNIEQFKNGLVNELDKMETHVMQNLTTEKLVKAFIKTYNKLEQDPSSYTKQPSMVSFKIKNLQEKKLKFNDFKSLKPIEQFHLLSSLPDSQKTGEGSSRATYVLGNGKAIKFAINKAGIEQNRSEARINRKLNSDLVPKLYDYDPRFQWLLVELVQPLVKGHENVDREYKNAGQEFEKLTGMPFENFCAVLDYYLAGDKIPDKFEKNPTFQKITNLIKSANLDVSDLSIPEQWGRGADGRLVLLDYGLTDKNKWMYKDKFIDRVLQEPDSFRESLKLSSVYKTQLLEKRFFDIDDFRRMPPTKQFLFLKQNSHEVGEGSSRRVYVIDGKTVLKLAKNDKGLAQNKTEVEAYNDPITKGIVAKVSEYSPDYRWIASEIARPINDENEFSQMIGSDADDFFDYFDRLVKVYLEKPDYIKTEKIKNPLMGKLMDLVMQKDMLPADLQKYSSWGKTADGRLVLIDYGFTEDVWRKHYKKYNDNLNSDEATARDAAE